jgi:hypothetical protein
VGERTDALAPHWIGHLGGLVAKMLHCILLWSLIKLQAQAAEAVRTSVRI